MRHWHFVPLLALSILGLPAIARADDTRQMLTFDKDWKFQVGDTKGADAPAFDDSNWRTLNVPHDYAIEGGGAPATDPAKLEGPFDPDSPAKPDGGCLDAGPAWYRKTFTLPPTAKNHRVAIQFDGVYMDSDVYLNGKLLGNHPYGYTPFQYDLTPYLNFDGPNILAVRTNVQQPSSRWYSGAGIYRHVYLDVTNPVHVAPWGTYITTSPMGDNGFRTTVAVTVRNDSDAAKTCHVITTFTDPDGTSVAEKAQASSGLQAGTTTTEEQIIPAHEEATFSSECRIPQPKLWSIETPQLYNAQTQIFDGNTPTDAVTTRIGLRTIEFTTDNGFLLNGKRVQIQGVCDHHDLGALGSAFNKRALQRQLEMLKTMGCNAIRTSHNPPAPELLDLADEMGFVVMDEAFDEWKRPKRKYGYSRFFDEWSEKDLVSMIHRDRNHPSVVLWSIGNEIPEQGPPKLASDTTNDTQPGATKGPGKTASEPYKEGAEMAKRLADICHREDPTRPVTAACNSAGSAAKTGFADALDVFGINYHARQYDDFKGRVLIASETSSALSTRGEYGLKLNAKGEVEIQIRPEGSFQCTSYDLDKPGWGATGETDLLALKHAPWVAGEFVWTGFDYIGEPTPYKWPSRSSYFGIIDLAGFPKDRFYLYQSQWAAKPVVHLLPHWNWPGFEGKSIPVWAFTNADSVELFLNGQSQGVRDWKDNKTLHLEWHVPYTPGTLKAVATKDGKQVATDEVITAGPPAKLELIADRPAIRADGGDLSFITIRVEDKDGHLCPNGDNEVAFTLSGPAEIAGVDNGDPTNHEAFKSSQHKAFHGLGLAIVRAKETTGTVTLKADAPGLEGASIEIKVSD